MECPICGLLLQEAKASFDGETACVGYMPCSKHTEPTPEERKIWEENLKQLCGG